MIRAAILHMRAACLFTRLYAAIAMPARYCVCRLIRQCAVCRALQYKRRFAAEFTRYATSYGNVKRHTDTSMLYVDTRCRCL